MLSYSSRSLWANAVIMVCVFLSDDTTYGFMTPSSSMRTSKTTTITKSTTSSSSSSSSSTTTRTTSSLSLTQRGWPTLLLASSSPSSPAAKKFKKVFVAGGSKGVGRCIIDMLRNEGIAVQMLVRDEAVANVLNGLEGVTAFVGDAMVIKDVEQAMDGCDAAISTLGGSSADDSATLQQRVDYVGNNHVIESAGILGVTRVILVTSVGCGSSRDAPPPNVYNVLKDVLAAKEKAENILIKYYTNTNWTIIRPGGLKSEPMTGKAVLTEDASVIGSIHREDVAKLVIDALASPNTERKILTAVDPTITSAVAVPGKQIEAFAL